MLADLTRKKWLVLTLILVGVFSILLTGLMFFRKYQQREKDQYTIGYIYSSKEISPKDLEITKFIIGKKLESINQNGGINNHLLRVIYLDDKSDMKALYPMVEKASQDENLIAFVGCMGVIRASTIGPILTRKNIPLISQYVFTQLVQNYPTIYSASVGVAEFKLLLKKLMFAGHSRIAFLGQRDLPTSATLSLDVLKEIVAEDPALSLPVWRFFPKNYDFESENFKSFTDSLRKQTDFLMVNIDIQKWKSFLSVLERDSLKIPIFTGSADISKFDPAISGFRYAELYSINSLGIPGTQNTNLHENLMNFSTEKDLSEFSPFQLSDAARIADEVGLIADAFPKQPLPGNKNIREQIIAGLQQYINGNRIYRGWLTDWYFNPDHTFGGHTLLAWKPANTLTPILSPYQVLRSNKLGQHGQVLYASIKPVKIDLVDDNASTFSAVFYLEVNTPGPFTLDKVDFSNAVKNENNHEPLIHANLIRSVKNETGFKFYNNLYLITGKFYFDAQLHRYPLDRQKFPIMLQSSNPLDVLLIQPSLRSNQNTDLDTEGWKFEKMYVGYSQDFISTDEYSVGLQKNIPFYKFGFVYILKRAHIDFFLKTLVPLLVILIITYFSVYIPPKEFEALAGIQVTGLLSSVALYFSAYKPDKLYTLSDNIFIFTYVMITTLIGTSILIYVTHEKNNVISRLMRLYQRYIFPVIVFAFTIYIRWLS